MRHGNRQVYCDVNNGNNPDQLCSGARPRWQAHETEALGNRACDASKGDRPRDYYEPLTLLDEIDYAIGKAQTFCP